MVNAKPRLTFVALANLRYINALNNNNNRSTVVSVIMLLAFILIINTKNCSLSVVLTATDQKPQKKFILKGDITHHHIA